MPDLPSCTSCGACCFSKLESYARVTGADYARLDDVAADVSVFIGNRCYLRMAPDRCAQLSVEPAGQFTCKVYERRPDVCRVLERGSPACAGERARKSTIAELASGSARA